MQSKEEIIANLMAKAAIINVLLRQGYFQEACRLAKESVETAESHLGVSHEDTLACKSTLGACLYKMRKFGEGREVLEEVRDIYLHKFGADHPLTAQVLNNLCLVYAELDQYPDAITAALKAVRIRMATFGLDNPATAISISNLGNVLSGLGIVEDAGTCYATCHHIHSRLGGEQAPGAREAYGNIEALYPSKSPMADPFIRPDVNWLAIKSSEVLESFQHLCDRWQTLIEKGPQIPFFILEHGRPRHARAYRRLFFGLKKQMANPAEKKKPVIFPIQVKYEHCEIPNVLDLRERPAQKWLLNFFHHGDVTSFIKNTMTEIDSFYDRLPALMYGGIGGSGVTSAIGSWLRTVGINALVFPSARSNVSVKYDTADKVTSFYGWNLVDYRDAELVPDLQIHVDTNPWYNFEQGQHPQAKLVAHQLSWSVTGVEVAYSQSRKLVLANL